MYKVYGSCSKVALISVLAFFLILPFVFAGGDQNGRQLSEWVDEVMEDFETVYPSDWNTFAENGNYTWGRTTHEPYEGTYCIWCASKNLNGQPTRFPSGNYDNNMSAWAVMGPINLQYCTEAELTFVMKYVISDNDAVGVYAHIGDNDWQGVKYSGNSNGWAEYEFDLANWPGLGNLLGLHQVYIAFSFYSNGATASTGAFVDNVNIKKFFTGWPDLVVEGIDFKADPHEQGSVFNMSTTVGNIGQNPSPQTDIQLFVSKDGNIDKETDLLLGSFAIPAALETGESYTLAGVYKTPIALPPGSYHIGAVVDHANSIVEEDETNNHAITENADFVITAFSGWDVVVNESFGTDFPSGAWARNPGNGNYSWGYNTSKAFEGNYSIWCTASNFNGVPNTWPESGYANNADSWVQYGPFDLINCQKADLSFVFSQKLHSDADRFKVMVSVGGGWQGFEYKTNSGGWLYQQLDLMAWPGWGSLKDFGRVFIAFNFTSNNVGNLEGTFVDKVVLRRQFIMPDLVCSVLTPTPVTLQPGDELAIASTVMNMGEKASEASKVDLYLSTDATITAGDVLLASNAVPALDVDDEAVFNNTVTLDAGLAEGDYFIGALVDGDNAVNETSETNNTKSAAVTVYVPKPDLVCDLVMANAIAANQIETKVTVTNNGEVASGATTVKYVLTNGAATDVGVVNVGALDPGASQSVTETLTLATPLTTGDYTLTAEADPDNAVVEEDEDNNDSAIDFSYVETGIDEVKPTEFALDQNYPNPFNPSTSIRYALPAISSVKLTVHNVNGQVVRVLVDRTMEAGAHEVVWDGTNMYGDKVATGIYFYQISAGSFKELRKMLLVQ